MHFACLRDHDEDFVTTVYMEDTAMQAQFAPLARALADNEQTIVAEFAAVQGKPADIGGYYLPDAQKCEAVMRPSATFNAVLAAVRG